MLRWRPLLVATTCAWLAPATVMACSGPGAAQTIAANEGLGGLCWLGTVIATAMGLVLLRRRGRPWRTLWPLPLLAIGHPGWWLSARSGDCGYLLRDSSIAVSVVSLLVLAGWLWSTRAVTVDSKGAT